MGTTPLDTFRESLSTARKAHGLSYVKVGKAAGVSHTIVCEFEKGRRLPTFDTIRKIAEALESPGLIPQAEAAIVWHWRNKSNGDDE